jgi:hypothetical protein
MSPAEVHRFVCSAFDEFRQRRFAGGRPENQEFGDQRFLVGGLPWEQPVEHGRRLVRVRWHGRVAGAPPNWTLGRSVLEEGKAPGTMPQRALPVRTILDVPGPVRRK